MSQSDMGGSRFNRRDVLKTMGASSVGAGAATAASGTSLTATQTDGYGLHVLSSRPDRVSGGDALLEIEHPETVDPQDLTVLRNGDDVTEAFETHPDQDAMSGVVDGLEEGENTIAVEDTEETVIEQTLINHPEIGPIFSGPNQQPFACTADEALDVQLEVDNQDGIGIPVEEDGTVIGYSMHCQVPDQVDYVYRNTDGEIQPFDPTEGEPADAASAVVDGTEVPYLIRWERGTRNRFIYSIAILDPDLEGGSEPAEYDPDAGWNGKLVYNFQGGVGIGHTQGRQGEGRMLRHEALSQGYAVVYSTGTRTGDHYNLQVGGETALMVKEEFVVRYGTPEYTIGLGGSGGGIQQYVYGQNHPDLIDGAIPRVSYPDMVTQTIHTGDCELLEYFMDVVDEDNEAWDTWSNRTWLIGFNGTDEVVNPITQEPGATECTNAWRGLTPLAMNPEFGSEENWDRLDENVRGDIEATHWDDLRNVYGVDDDGYAKRTWDNVGVQYGLQALLDGNIDQETFGILNGVIGGWKPSAEMVQEGFPFVDDGDFDPWSARNMTHEGQPDFPEQRVSGDMSAMKAAYEEGIVFRGDIDLPIIDWRPHMEAELDMHNTHQSFAARQRIIDYREAHDTDLDAGDGHAEGHVVWFTDADSDLAAHALDVMDEWLSNLQDDPGAGLDETRPEAAVDACYDGDGQDPEDLIASGPDVWNGILTDSACGECCQTYETYTSSRIVAGSPISGDYFKCQLQSVEEAIESGVYGDLELDEDAVQTLKLIFPDGVCDYERPSAGEPHLSGLTRGVWDSVAANEETITAVEYVRARSGHQDGEDLERIARPMTNDEWTTLQAYADDNLVGPPQISDAYEGPPTTLGADDGLYRDIRGDGQLTINDVQALFSNLDADEVQDYAPVYNFSDTDPETVTVFDVQALFNQLTAD